MTQQTRSAQDNPAWTYETETVPTLFGLWTPEVIRMADPKSGEHALDVGCGTGIAARRIEPLVRPGGKVVGLDLNPNMLAVAREVGEQEGVTVEWHQGNAQELPFPDNSFDLVTAQFVLMFLPDRKAGLAEMRRVLKDGGRLVATVWQSIDLHPLTETLHLVLERRLGISALKMPFSLGDPDDLRQLLSMSGWRKEEIRSLSKTHRFPDPKGFLKSTIETATAALPEMQYLDAKERQAVVASIQEEMEEPLSRVTEGDYVIEPWHAHVVRAER